ncbi:MAG: biotin/lipoyl-binding protein, partial [Bacteroidota bacterium]|nr:biotin/lipoyl-binding protein [Bacteroidota bacterium]
MNWKKILIEGIILIVCLSACKNKRNLADQAEQVQSYPTAVLSLQNIELESVYPAVIKGQEDIDIKPRVDGFIEHVYVDEGSIVKRGQTLFSINSPS